MDVFSTKMFDCVKLLWSKTNRWHKGLLIFIIVELKILPGGQVGFTCNDPALSYPFTGDTISWKLLMITIILLPLVVMLMTERKYHADKIIQPKKQALDWYKEYLFGVLLNLIIIQVLKLIVGSPRPHFFDTCSPKEALTCEGSEYIPSYTCTKAHWLSQSDKSFPSGHTSLAIHAGFFLVYYLRRRTSCSPRSNTILTIQVLCILTAAYCSISRIIDRRHHWWDVLAGAVIAIPVLLYTIQHLCRNFECSAVVSEDLRSDSNNDSNNVPLIDTKENFDK